MSKLLTADDLQVQYPFKQTTTYKMMNSKGFPLIRIGGRIYVKQDDFERWLEKQKPNR